MVKQYRIRGTDHSEGEPRVVTLVPGNINKSLAKALYWAKLHREHPINPDPTVHIEVRDDKDSEWRPLDAL